MALFIVCALIGVLLGLRFKAFVLLPASGILFAFLAAEAVVYSNDFGWLSVMAAAGCMQGGYAVGSALRPILTRSTRRVSISVPPEGVSKRVS
jgi:hypothetical protein